MLELGTQSGEGSFTCGYRIYITGDTLLIDELNDIPKRYAEAGREVDLMLMHLGGTTIPGPSSESHGSHHDLRCWREEEASTAENVDLC